MLGDIGIIGEFHLDWIPLDDDGMPRIAAALWNNFCTQRRTRIAKTLILFDQCDH